MAEVIVRNMTFDRAWAICRMFEKVNDMPSETFVAKYYKGTVEPSPLAMRWVSTYEAMLRLAPIDLDIEEDLRIPA